MNTFSRAALLLGLLTLGCKKDASETAATAGDGTITWTQNGQSYTSTLYSSAIVDTGDKIIITGSPADLNTVVSLALPGINAKGAGTYDLPRRAGSTEVAVGGLTLDAKAPSTARPYETLFGPAASNGTITVTQYDKASQKLSGTFSFTAGAMPSTSATGTQAVTNGSFSFTRFR
ncbi:DUF6252 family protein [Hymenobacter actinosclerus]|uniref:Lipocalin-like domain-containing protein n=1 Tax=Hymenobacter actinosclerus TaxID=82805 RepID=A0A1I0A3M0_9BACT|nr:DUF6252 family protein [Hymenobacter actinosclerus]SES88671.1 hypothetical protein SAMN04487998_0577 [Hymenobacter actinosclerus]